MITRLDPHTRAQIERFRLVFTCEGCASFEPASGQCSLGYPNAMHRTRDLRDAESIVFCKEFDPS